MANLQTPKYQSVHHAWVRENIPRYEHLGKPGRPDGTPGIATKRMWEAFCAQFPDLPTTHSGFSQFVAKLRHGGVGIPLSPVESLSRHLLRIQSPVTLVTSDYQVPYHDSEWVEWAFKLAIEWGVHTHVINGDLFDFATLSKFSPSIHGHRRSAGDELTMGRAIIAASEQEFKQTVFIPGNHEWRLFLRILMAELTDEQAQELLTGNGPTKFTPLSYCILNDAIRVTHPGSASIVAASVARALADRHQMNVIVGHNHGIGFAMNYSGRLWACESGGMFDPDRMDYGMLADRRRPASNQGFVILEGNTPFLITPHTAHDRDLWLRFAESARIRREQAAKA